MTIPKSTTTWFLVGSAAAAVATTWVWGRWKSASFLGRQPRWFPWWSKFSRSYWIRNVKIPIAYLSKTDAETAAVDHEGLVLCHVGVRHGKIATLVLATSSETTPSSASVLVPPVLDLQGQGLLFTCAVDAHTHLVKTESVPRRPNALGTWSQALEGDFVDEARYWKLTTRGGDNNTALEHNDVYRRMNFAIQCALHYGTRALRTHLDGCASEDPAIRDVVYAVFTSLRQRYADRLVLQAVANLYLPLWCDEPYATAHADRAAATPGVVLGAYVGNHEHEEAVQGLTALFRQAQRVGNMDVDLHLDESNDPKCCALRALVDDRVLPAARKAGYTGRVVLGHVCSLSLQTAQAQRELVSALARDPKVYVVANPVTNLALQDRNGSAAPQSVPIPADIPRTPQWRGLTLMQELQAAGVSVAAATDNVRDGWYAYGDYDWLTTWMAALSLAHLDTAPTAGHWAHLLSDAPAVAMGLLDDADGNNARLLAVGQPADFVLFPTTRRLTELLARPANSLRWVVRGGRVQSTTLPDFDVLEDLMTSDRQPHAATRTPHTEDENKSDGHEEEVWGNLEDKEDADGVNDMADAEARAQAERFRKIGFHEAYDGAKEESLQEGFEAGFRETFDAAQDIGKILGKAVMNATFEEAMSDEDGQLSARSENASLDSMKLMIREQLTASDLRTSDLQDLKTKLEQTIAA